MANGLEHSHHPDEVAARLAQGPRVSYLYDAVFGAIDGTVTTFAVVAGAVGADLSARVVLILGAANLIGDGFSMAAGNYAGTRSSLEMAEKLRTREHRHIDLDPEGEVTEIREIYRAKGFTGSALEQITGLITSRRGVWIETMLAEEYGVSNGSRSPWRAGFATFLAFIAAGALPLLPFLFGVPDPALVATGVTAAVFFLIGSVRSHWSPRNWFNSGLETLAIGMGAAVLAYGVGWLAGRLV